jgi:hypothetical protein
LPQWLVVRRTGRATRLVLSNAVRSAAVLGGTRPVIAVNPALAETLAAEDVDRVVVHEWAHVDRRDDCALLLQVVAHLVAGWHPAVWWLNRQLHFEREVACDERVVGMTGSARAYAGCLAALAALSSTRGRALPVVSASSQLRRRVVRILREGATWGRVSRVAIATASLLPVAVAARIADLHLVSAGPAAIAAQVAQAVNPVDQSLRPVATNASATISGTAPGKRGARTTSPTIVAARADAPPETRTAVAAAVTNAGETPVESGSEMPAIPSLPSAIDWAYTTLRDNPAANLTPGVSEGVTPPPDQPTLWGAAATGGMAIGRGSQKAAISTAGFFTRVGRSLAGSF